MTGRSGADSIRWLGCVVCGDDSEFVAVADHSAETELMCCRCGQARLVPVLAAVALDESTTTRRTA